VDGQSQNAQNAVDEQNPERFDAVHKSVSPAPNGPLQCIAQEIASKKTVDIIDRIEVNRFR